MTARWVVSIALAASVVLGIAGSARAESHLLIITGVGGDEQDAAQFGRWASTLVDAAVAHGLPASDVIRLGEGAGATSRATRENVTRAFQDLARRVQRDDEVVIVLIGHGSFDGRTAAFNLPGPDLTAADYVKLLDAIGSQHVAFVNTSGASGAFLPSLAGPGRAIVTATATGGERNDTRFPQYFVEAFTTDAADRDHDGHVSLLEAFEYARRQVADAYRKEGLLQVEHAKLEDGVDGAFAATFVLGGAPANADPGLKALEQERHELELKIAALRQRKAVMDQQQYDALLERLLVELAARTRAIKERQAKP